MSYLNPPAAGFGGAAPRVAIPCMGGELSFAPEDAPAAHGLLNHLQGRFGNACNWMPALSSMEREIRALPEDQRDLLRRCLFQADADQLRQMEMARGDPQRMAQMMMQAGTPPGGPVQSGMATAPSGAPPAHAMQAPMPGHGSPYLPARPAWPPSYVASPPPAPYGQPLAAFQAPPSITLSAPSWGAAPWAAPTTVIHVDPHGAGGTGWCGGWGGYSPYVGTPCFAAPPFFGGFGGFGGYGGFGNYGGFGGHGGFCGFGPPAVLAGAAAAGVGGMLGAGLGGLMGAGLGAMAFGFL